MASIIKPKKQTVEMYSPVYFGLCTLGGSLACAPSHTAVTPLDLIKCRLQVDRTMYQGNLDGWRKIYKADGVRGVFLGWTPTFVGYGLQGAGKYGFYELFKYNYGRLFPDANKTVVFLGASASAEFFADIFLCPFEAVKVRMQTSVPPFARTMREGMSKIMRDEGVAGFYKGLYPLWGRQIPYTMLKFASFENIVAEIYRRLPGEKEDYGKLAQTGVSFVAGFAAGLICAAGSQCADVMVSKLNAERKPGEPFGTAVARIYQKIGFLGLWNGLAIRSLMIGCLTATQWLIYDSFKLYCGLPTTGH